MLVIATCQVGSAITSWAAKILTSMVLEFQPKPVDVKISAYDSKTADGRNTFTCVSTITKAEESQVMTYLKGLSLTIPETAKSTINDDEIAVGSCLYRLPDGTKYVRVAIGAYSVPLMLKGDSSWDRVATRQAVLKTGIGGYLLDQIFNALERKAAFIIERARKKPLNLSMVSESGKSTMVFFREVTTGHFEPAEKSDLPVPDYKPVVVFLFSKLKHFALIEDKLYRIFAFTSKRDFDAHNKPVKTVSAPVDARDGYFLIEDCRPLDPADTFTIEKIERCLKNKL